MTRLFWDPKVKIGEMESGRFIGKVKPDKVRQLFGAVAGGNPSVSMLIGYTMLVSDKIKSTRVIYIYIYR